MKLTLVSPNTDLCEQWERAFCRYLDSSSGPAAVRIVNGYFQELQGIDCFVSPANSYGIMDGGVDLKIREFFEDKGVDIQNLVQRKIFDEFGGEQPVGTSLLIPVQMADNSMLWLAHTPTVRVKLTDISKTFNAFYAMKAMLLAVKKWNRTESRKIQSVACTGLGTFSGNMNPAVAADQMALAYVDVVERNEFDAGQINWDSAFQREAKLSDCMNWRYELQPASRPIIVKTNNSLGISPVQHNGPLSD